MEIQKLKLSNLKPAEYNPRQSTKAQEKQLKSSLKKFGIVEPIIVNQNKDRKNIVVGGHFRLRELKKLGYKEVDCVLVDLSLQDEKELNVRLNKNTGEWDRDILANQFEIQELTNWGFEEIELGIQEIETPKEITQEENRVKQIIIECDKNDESDIKDFITLKLKETSFNINIK